jgi:hypothetical protein
MVNTSVPSLEMSLPLNIIPIPTTTRSCRSGAPAPHKIAEQIKIASIQCQMAVRHANGEAMEKTLTWAANEVEGFMRN